MEPHVIIVGFGLPGRSVAEALESASIPHVVIERNREVVERCRLGGRSMVLGDARDVGVLRQAGLASATLVALMIPGDEQVLETLDVILREKPDAQVVVRSTFTSTGLEAIHRGALKVVVAEQVVASAATLAVKEALSLANT